jgi:hypothetical protein
MVNIYFNYIWISNIICKYINIQLLSSKMYLKIFFALYNLLYSALIFND